MFNGFMEDWWKPKGYDKWYHYALFMPILAVWALGLFIAQKVFKY